MKEKHMNRRKNNRAGVFGETGTSNGSTEGKRRKKKRPADNSVQSKRIHATESLLAGLNLFSEDFDDAEETELYAAASEKGKQKAVPMPSVLQDNSSKPVKKQKAGAQKEPEISPVQGMLSEGRVLQTMEEGLADLMDIDYIPEPDEIIIQRREFETTMYQEPKQDDNRMLLDSLPPAPPGISESDFPAMDVREGFRDPGHTGVPENNRLAIRKESDDTLSLRPDKKENRKEQPDEAVRLAGKEPVRERRKEKPERDGSFLLNTPETKKQKPGKHKEIRKEALKSEKKPVKQEHLPERSKDASFHKPATEVREKPKKRNFGFIGNDSEPAGKKPRRSDGFERQSPKPRKDNGFSMRIAEPPKDKSERIQRLDCRTEKEQRKVATAFNRDDTKPEQNSLFAPDDAMRRFGASNSRVDVMEEFESRKERGESFSDSMQERDSARERKRDSDNGWNKERNPYDDIQEWEELRDRRKEDENRAQFNRIEKDEWRDVPERREAFVRKEDSSKPLFYERREDSMRSGFYDRSDSFMRQDPFERKKESEKRSSLSMDFESSDTTRERKRNDNGMSMTGRERKKRWEL